MKRLILMMSVVSLSVMTVTIPSGASGKLTEDPTEFAYGVGSNDVGPTSALLWTQTTASTVVAQWSTDPSFTGGGKKTVTVDTSHDGTVLVKVSGLTSATTYYYRFKDPSQSVLSRVGSFQTAPDPSSEANLTFAISGDQDGTLKSGSPCFNTFGAMGSALAENPQFYVNLGDTIYSDSKCLDQPAVSLDEYRALYKQNLTYDNLLNLRAGTSFYTQWDDHEVRNDFDRTTVDPTLFSNGRRAFAEYDGLQPPSPSLGFYRHFRWGQEAEIFILDERSFRTTEADRIDSNHDGTPDCQNPTTGQPDLAPTLVQSVRDQFAQQFPSFGLDQTVSAACTADLNRKGRSILGTAQREQFLSDLANSTATFKIVINEDPIQQFFAFPFDRWEGYRWERQTILRSIDSLGIKNVVWLSTDVHATLAHTVDFNTDTPGSSGGVQGMFEYTVGPVATDTLGKEIDQLTGTPESYHPVAGFLLDSNANTCADFDLYSYAVVQIDAASHAISILPKLENGFAMAANGGTTNGFDNFCYDYHATAS